MNQSAATLDDELCDIYEQQARQYETVLQLSEQAAAAFAAGAAADEHLRRLNSLLDQIARLNAASKPTRSRWESLRRDPSSRLRQSLERLQGLTRRALDGIDRAEELARQARDRLLPELRQEALGRRMQQAYAQYGALDH